MESWYLVIALNRGAETVPVRVPVSDYEHCIARGKYAETLAATLKDVKIEWSCQPSQQ
jgi:hypothetical protein